VSLHDGLDSTLLMLSHRLKRYSDRPEIRVVKQYGDLQPVWCYPGQLNQVFINLLSNAIEALDQAWQQQIAQQSSGETAQWTPTITLQTVALKTDQGPQAELVIQDNGIGISETIRHRLFDPFFTTKPVGKGTGLGLAIAYQIVVDRHGGQINCESTLGKGTTFRLRLPVGQPATDPIA
jgi:signal transduction histidine kinase